MTKQELISFLGFTFILLVIFGGGCIYETRTVSCAVAVSFFVAVWVIVAWLQLQSMDDYYNK